MRPILRVHVYFNSLSTSGRIHGYLPHFSINGTNTLVSKAMKPNITTRTRHTHIYIHTQAAHTHTYVKLISNSNKYWRKEEKNPNDGGGDITRGFFSIGLNVVVHHQKDVHIIFYLHVPRYPSSSSQVFGLSIIKKHVTGHY